MVKFHVELAACGQERQKKREKTRVNDVCGHNHTPSTHIYDDGDVSYGSLYLSTNSNLPRCLRVDQQQLSVMLARASLATCCVNDPMVDYKVSYSIFVV